MARLTRNEKSFPIFFAHSVDVADCYMNKYLVSQYVFVKGASWRPSEVLICISGWRLFLTLTVYLTVTMPKYLPSISIKISATCPGRYSEA